MKDILSIFKAEEVQLAKMLEAVRASIAAYEAPAAAVGEAVKVARAKQNRAQKQRKKRAAITEGVRTEVIRLKSLPEAERPSIPKIAAKMNVSDTTVQRIWAEHQKSRVGVS